MNTIKNAFDDYETKQRAAELARAQALDGHELSGICSREWTEMWNHVKSFVQTYNAELDFPRVKVSLALHASKQYQVSLQKIEIVQ